MDGLIWRSDRADPLSLAEYRYWERRVLPFGWSIVRAPVEQHRESRRGREGVITPPPEGDGFSEHARRNRPR
jgi:hypothetical protein